MQVYGVDADDKESQSLSAITGGRKHTEATLVVLVVLAVVVAAMAVAWGW